MKSYRLYGEVDIYPYEIEVYNPRSNEPKPEWLTDVLKFNGIDEDGIIVYCESKDENGGITYPIPKINGHIYIPMDSVVAKDLNTGSIFPFKIEIIKEFYKEKLNFVNKIKKCINGIKAAINLKLRRLLWMK